MVHSMVFVKPETSFQDPLGQPIRPIVYFYVVVYEKESNGFAGSVTLATGLLEILYCSVVLCVRLCLLLFRRHNLV
jgi:hypothetical protein